ncbi:hypothetical protein ACS0PU_000965 [Formica fusca]
MKYMDIILEHGSTEDDGLDSIEMSQKKIVELFDNREENASDSSNSSKRMINKTKYRSQKNMRESINREESECSCSSNSENEKKSSKKRNLNFDDSRERNSSSSKKNVNGNLKNKNASTSTLRTDRNKSTKRNQNQPSNVDARYNSGIISHSESSSSKNTQNIDGESNRHTSSRLEVGARTMSQQQFQEDVLEGMNNISRLLQTMSPFTNPTSKPDGFPELPLKSDDDFKKLEELLSKKTVYAGGHEIPAPAYTYLKELLLSTISGAHQRASVMNMLKYVITNELAMTYNWKGQKKKSFETTKLREVITDAAQMRFKKNNCDQCIKYAIQSWLSMAKSRHMHNANARKN